MRGKVEQREQMQISIGITPAYAGKSEAPASRYTYRQDHPRLCGEKLVTSGNSGMGIGSPPPMRGKGPEN